jgi:hypothetical protein
VGEEEGGECADGENSHEEHNAAEAQPNGRLISRKAAKAAKEREDNLTAESAKIADYSSGARRPVKPYLLVRLGSWRDEMK